MRRAVIAAAAMILAFPLAARAEPGEAHPPSAGAPEETGEYSLKQREDWLSARVEKAKDVGSIDGAEAERVGRELDRLKQEEDRDRATHEGRALSDAETTDLETRLDDVADKIHWLHENGFWRPW